MDNIEEIITKAGELNDAFQYEAAYTLLSKYLNTEISSPSFYFYFAISAYEMGAIDKAEESLLTGIKIISTNAPESRQLIWFYHELAVVYSKGEKIDAALEYCYKSIRLALQKPYRHTKNGLAIGVEFAFAQVAPQLSTLAVLFQLQHKFHEAYQLLSMIKIYANSKYDLDSLSAVSNELGIVCFVLNKPYEGIVNLKKSLRYKQLIGKNTNQSYSNLLKLIEQDVANLNLEFVKALFES